MMNGGVSGPIIHRFPASILPSSLVSTLVIFRAMLWTSVLCFGGAVLLALLAVLDFAHAVSLSAGWFLIASGGVLGFAGVKTQEVLREQTEALAQKNSESELLHTQIERQKKAVDALADGLDVAVFICDSKGHVLYANKRATDLFKFDDPVGRSILAVTLSYDLEQLILLADREQAAQSAELVFTYPDEKMGQAKAWVELDERGRVFLSIYEITDLRRLERIRQDFVANVSHELRTPLTVIRAMAETLTDKDEDDEERKQRYLQRILDEVDRLSIITQDLLILSAAESNPVRKQACDIADVFRVVLSQLETKSSDKGLVTSFEGPEHCRIEANKAQMTQVAYNLIDNAINYTTHGSVTVTVNCGEDEVEISIADTGIGIALEHQPRIFERFYRVDRARSRSTGGTGLGLSIVKHIVEAHGGHVAITSSLNQGSMFTIRIPTGEVSPVEEKD